VRTSPIVRKDAEALPALQDEPRAAEAQLPLESLVPTGDGFVFSNAEILVSPSKSGQRRITPGFEGGAGHWVRFCEFANGSGKRSKNNKLQKASRALAETAHMGLY